MGKETKNKLFEKPLRERKQRNRLSALKSTGRLFSVPTKTPKIAGYGVQ